MKKIGWVLGILLVLGCTRNDAKKALTQNELLTREVWNFYQVHRMTWVNDSLVFNETDTLNGTADFDTDKTVTIKVPDEDTRVFSWGLFDDELLLDGSVYDLETLSEEEMILSIIFMENDPDDGEIRTRDRLFFRH